MSWFRLRFRANISRRARMAFVLAGMSFLFAVWVLIKLSGLLPDEYFPGPVDVFRAAVTMFGQEDLHKQMIASITRVGGAFIVSALLAIPLGLLMSSFNPIRGIFAPIVEFVRYVPVPALAPIFVLWAGIGEETKFLVLFFGTFFQLVLLIMNDADLVPQICFDIARTLGASTRHLIRHVLIRSLLPQIYNNLRVILGWCWTYLVIAELVAVEAGLGLTIKEAQRFSATDQLFVCFIVLGFIGLISDSLMARGHRWLFPYSVKSRTNGSG